MKDLYNEIPPEQAIARLKTILVDEARTEDDVSYGVALLNGLAELFSERTYAHVTDRDPASWIGTEPMPDFSQD